MNGSSISKRRASTRSNGSTAFRNNYLKDAVKLPKNHKVNLIDMAQRSIS